MIDLETVRHVARLARLHLEPDELERMREELSGILQHIERIQSLDLEGVPPTAHVVALENVLREDVPQPCLTVAEALREAPEVIDDAFAVRRMA